MPNYAILDDDGNVINTIVADQAFIDSQGFAQFLIIDAWLDGSRGPIDTTKRWDAKASRFIDSVAPEAVRIRGQADRPSDADALAASIVDKMAEAQAAAAVAAPVAVAK